MEGEQGIAPYPLLFSLFQSAMSITASIHHLFRMVLLPLCIVIAGCGEIELPGDDDKDTPTNPEKPSDNQDKDSPSEDNGNDKPSGGEDGDSPSGGGGNTDQPSTGDEDQSIRPISGTGCSIVDGKHLLLDGYFYISRDELMGCYGAFADPDLFAVTLEYADNYEEEELKNWRIPTEDEARILKMHLDSYTMEYGKEPLPLVNTVLYELGWDPINNYLRYLCANGEKSFRLTPDGKVTKSGSKTTYSVRLVCPE